MNTFVHNADHARNEVGHARQEKSSDRATLAAIAHRAMIERGLEPDFPQKALQELAVIQRPADPTIERGFIDFVRD